MDEQLWLGLFSHPSSNIFIPHHFLFGGVNNQSLKPFRLKQFMKVLSFINLSALKINCRQRFNKKKILLTLKISNLHSSHKKLQNYLKRKDKKKSIKDKILEIVLYKKEVYEDSFQLTSDTNVR